MLQFALVLALQTSQATIAGTVNDAHSGEPLKAAVVALTDLNRSVLTDSSGREFPVGRVSFPVHRVYWLDTPPLSAEQRAALNRAFDEAALYDEAARTAADEALLGAAPVPRVVLR